MTYNHWPHQQANHQQAHHQQAHHHTAQDDAESAMDAPRSWYIPVQTNYTLPPSHPQIPVRDYAQTCPVASGYWGGVVDYPFPDVTATSSQRPQVMQHQQWSGQQVVHTQDPNAYGMSNETSMSYQQPLDRRTSYVQANPAFGRPDDPLGQLGRDGAQLEITENFCFDEQMNEAVPYDGEEEGEQEDETDEEGSDSDGDDGRGEEDDQLQGLETPGTSLESNEAVPLVSTRKPPYTCQWDGCNPFARQADLRRHVDIVHKRKTLALKDCPLYRQNNCKRAQEKGFTRQDKVYEHLDKVHGMRAPRKPAGRRDVELRWDPAKGGLYWG